MSYFSITFTQDLIRDLLIEASNLDPLYQALPQQLWNLSGPHGRLLQDGEFYSDKIKDNYGVGKLPKIPGEHWVGNTWPGDIEHTYNDEQELMALWQKTPSWSLNDRLILASKMGSLVLVKYLIEQGADIHSKNDWALGEAALNGHLEVLT